MASPALAGSRLVILLIATALATTSATPDAPTSGRLSRAPMVTAASVPVSSPRTSGPTPDEASHLPAAPVAAPALAVPAALTNEGLGLRSGPVAVPLELRIPSISVNAAVEGVGITPNNVMDAPMGPAQDPVWQQAFWYRGSAVPGVASTALMAGHIDDPLGRPGVFAHIDRLQPGDPIVVHDTRTGVEIRFAVTGSETYSLGQAAEPAVLTEIYGAGPVAGTVPQLSTDGVAHLTLITCAGTFRNGTHDHRLVVYAIRVG